MPKNSQVKRTIKLTIDKYLRTQDDAPEFKGLCAALLDLSYNKASLIGEVLAEHYKDKQDIPTDVKAFRKILLSHLEDDMKTANVFVVDEFDDDEEGGDDYKAQVFVPSSLPPTTDDDQKGATLPDSALSAVNLRVRC